MSCRSALVAVALVACTNCPPDYHVIRGMRVLGTTFDPPVAAPGGVVTVRAVTADVEDRPVVVAWYRCPAPLVLTTLAVGPGDGGAGDGGPRGATDPGADLAALVAPCLAAGTFAEGVAARVPIDAAGGARDVVPWRGARRWTDLVGFACAGGAIEPPPQGGLWPRCTGARGVVFTASIPGPRDDGDPTPPAPATLGDFTLGGRPWAAESQPAVARCTGSRVTCAAVRITFRAEGADVLTEPTGFGVNVLGPPLDGVVFAGYHVTAAAPGRTDVCEPEAQAVLQTSGDGARLDWVPPGEAGVVTFWFTARRLSGGFVVARRTARVE